MSHVVATPLSDALVIALMGPTASGKTQLALDIAKRLPIEIISVDSAMVYRGMDIGTSKPSAVIRSHIPHHLIDILDPSETFSAGTFRTMALECIASIHARGNIPLLVGGTMLYFKALSDNFSALPTASVTIRQRLTEEAKQLGWQHLYERLQRIDPDASKRIHVNDPQRILRALDVYEQTGVPLTTLQKEGQYVNPSHLRWIVWALGHMDRSILHARIHARMEQMFSEGFVEEVKRLYARGDLRSDLSSMRSVGYRQVWHYLEGMCNEDQMKNLVFIATRQLAKRQLTWLRSWPRREWIDGCSVDELVEKIKKGENK